MATTKRRNILDEIMDEPIRMPGVPQLIVTRGYAYQELKRLGYSERDKGFGGIDYMTMHQKPSDEPLADVETRDCIMAAVERSMNAALGAQ